MGVADRLEKYPLSINAQSIRLLERPSEKMRKFSDGLVYCFDKQMKATGLNGLTDF
ncbi:hypothetical protein l11_02970 [Neisseria weaveri LMG 5135]|nr:hypothetical protein l11_02970 [Neisseria weaveri LMG 5135]